MTDWKFERKAQAWRDRQLNAYLKSLEPHHYCAECDAGMSEGQGEVCDECLKETEEENE